MAIFSRTFAVVIALTAAAGALGGWAGVQYGLSKSHIHSGLDELIHERLALTAQQTQAISEIETRFSGRRTELEAEMRAANRDLANAIQKEPEFGPRAQLAISRFHEAESALQQDTIKHVLAMRRVLTPEQGAQFDKEVSRALNAE